MYQDTYPRSRSGSESTSSTSSSSSGSDDDFQQVRNRRSNSKRLMDVNILMDHCIKDGMRFVETEEKVDFAPSRLLGYFNSPPGYESTAVTVLTADSLTHELDVSQAYAFLPNTTHLSRFARTLQQPLPSLVEITKASASGQEPLEFRPNLQLPRLAYQACKSMQPNVEIDLVTSRQCFEDILLYTSKENKQIFMHCDEIDSTKTVVLNLKKTEMNTSKKVWSDPGLEYESEITTNAVASSRVYGLYLITLPAITRNEHPFAQTTPLTCLLYGEVDASDNNNPIEVKSSLKDPTEHRSVNVSKCLRYWFRSFLSNAMPIHLGLYTQASQGVERLTFSFQAKDAKRLELDTLFQCIKNAGINTFHYLARSAHILQVMIQSFRESKRDHSSFVVKFKFNDMQIEAHD